MSKLVAVVWLFVALVVVSLPERTDAIEVIQIGDAQLTRLANDEDVSISIEEADEPSLQVRCSGYNSYYGGGCEHLVLWTTGTVYGKISDDCSISKWCQDEDSSGLKAWNYSYRLEENENNDAPTTDRTPSDYLEVRNSVLRAEVSNGQRYVSLSGEGVTTEILCPSTITYRYQCTYSTNTTASGNVTSGRLTDSCTINNEWCLGNNPGGLKADIYMVNKDDGSFVWYFEPIQPRRG